MLQIDDNRSSNGHDTHNYSSAVVCICLVYRNVCTFAYSYVRAVKIDENNYNRDVCRGKKVKTKKQTNTSLTKNKSIHMDTNNTSIKSTHLQQLQQMKTKKKRGGTWTSTLEWTRLRTAPHAGSGSGSGSRVGGSQQVEHCHDVGVAGVRDGGCRRSQCLGLLRPQQ